MMGLTAVVLKSVGTIPVVSEEWMMVDMRGSREKSQVFCGQRIQQTRVGLGFKD